MSLTVTGPRRLRDKSGKTPRANQGAKWNSSDVERFAREEKPQWSADRWGFSFGWRPAGFAGYQRRCFSAWLSIDVAPNALRAANA